jgi:hypothetical protein
MAIDWVINEKRLSLLCRSEEGVLTPLIEFENDVYDSEDAFELVSRCRDEILEICHHYGVDSSKIKGLD